MISNRCTMKIYFMMNSITLLISQILFFFISLIKFKMVRLGIILEFRGHRVFDKERNNHHLIGSMYLNKLLEKANHQASKTHKGAFQLYQVEGRPVTFAGDRQ